MGEWAKVITIFNFLMDHIYCELTVNSLYRYIPVKHIQRFTLVEVCRTSDISSCISSSPKPLRTHRGLWHLGSTPRRNSCTEDCSMQGVDQASSTHHQRLRTQTNTPTLYIMNFWPGTLNGRHKGHDYLFRQIMPLCNQICNHLCNFSSQNIQLFY